MTAVSPIAPRDWGIPLYGTTVERDLAWPTPAAIPLWQRASLVEPPVDTLWDGSSWLERNPVAGTNAKRYGVAPENSGAANAAGMALAIAAAGNNGQVILPPGVYNWDLGVVLTATTNVKIFAYGARLVLSGVNAFGFKLTGINDFLGIYGATIVCSGVVADNHCGVGTAVTPGLGTGGSHVEVRDVTVVNPVRGIYLDVGTTHDFFRPKIVNCTIAGTVGTSSGQGYGITLSGCRLGLVDACYVGNSTRHGIYISAGDDNMVRSSVVYRHRFGIGTGNTIAGFEFARGSRNVAFGCTAVECTDGGMDVLQDESGVRESRDNKVLGCTFIDSTTNDLVIGNTAPSTSGAYSGTVVYGNTFTRSSSATNAGFAIRVNSGLDVQIHGNSFNGQRAYTITICPIYLAAAEGAAYTNRVILHDNQVDYTATAAGFVSFVEIAAALATGASRIDVFNTRGNLSGGAGQNLIIYDATRTSTTIRVRDNFLPDSQTAVANEGVTSLNPTDRGDANVTLLTTDHQQQRFATTLTANRTVTLPSTGSYFRIIRTGLGAFTLDVGGLKTIPSGTAAFVEVRFDGGAWRLTGYGTL